MRVCVCVCVEEERGWSGGWGGADVRVVEREGDRGGAIFVDRWLYYSWPNLNCGQIKHRDELGLEASAEGRSTSQLEMWEAGGSARPTLTGPLRDSTAAPAIMLISCSRLIYLLASIDLGPEMSVGHQP